MPLVGPKPITQRGGYTRETMEENILPHLPTPEEIARAQDGAQYEEIAPYLLDATENYPEPYFMLEYNGVPFSTLGGIQALSGQKKNGKTFLLAQLMAAVLGTDIGNTRTSTYLPGLRVPQRTIDHLGHLPTVLYVDTEMEKLNSAKVLRRVHWLCGWPMDEPAERFHVLWLRSVTDIKDESDKVIKRAYQRRYDLIKQAIDILHPDAVFIDGIRDIIGDFNDNAESSALVTELMALAETRHICIWNTLHMNPRPKNDDESKMRGHLGTELGNKITDTLVCIKHKENGQVWFTVKQDDARGKDMEDWEFVVTEAAGALGVPQMRSTVETVINDKEQNLLKEADMYFSAYAWTKFGATYTDLDKWLRHKGGLTSNRKIQSLFETARENGLITRDEKKRFHYNGSRPLPNDETPQMPFETSTENDAPF